MRRAEIAGREKRPRLSLPYRVVRKIGFLLRLRLETNPGWLWQAAIGLLAALMRIYCRTLRYAIDDRAGYFNGSDAPAIFLLWHNRIFAMPSLYRRLASRKRRTLVLTSAGPEGSLLALLLARFKIGAVRGSTSRRSSVAVRELAARIAEGYDIMITPDGPRGPRYRLQPGGVFLAQKNGAAPFCDPYRMRALLAAPVLGRLCHSPSVLAGNVADRWTYLRRADNKRGGIRKGASPLGGNHAGFIGDGWSQLRSLDSSPHVEAAEHSAPRRRHRSGIYYQHRKRPRPGPGEPERRTERD